MKNKYNAKKVVYDDLTFDSKMELNIYKRLKELEKDNIIYNLDRQVKFELIAKNDKYRACNYIADFVFCTKSKHYIIDVKGLVLPEFKIKQKIFYDKYKEEITIVKSVKDLDSLMFL